MAIARQSGSPTTPFNDGGAGATTTFNLTNVTNGCGVVVIFGIQNSPFTATTATATVGGETMTAVGVFHNWSSQQLLIFYLPAFAGSTGTKAVVITPDLVSFSYTSAGFALDKPIALDGTARATSAQTINVTATVADTWGFSVATDGNATPAVDTGNGFTSLDIGDPATYTCAQYKDNMGASGSKTFTQTGAAFQSIYAALFRDSSAAPPASILKQMMEMH